MNAPDVWGDVVGQAGAIAALSRAAASPSHAYLFVGPPGSTKDRAARAFAALVLSGGPPDGQPVATTRDARLALAGEHPDVHEVQRVGAAISVPQAQEIVRVASLAPVEGARKVLVLHEFHLVQPGAAAALLKTIEEPPGSVVFIVLADFVPPDLVTIASRCARIEFRAIPSDVLADRLAAEGIDAGMAAEAARAAGGDLDRARILATDPALAERRRAFADAPYEIDGAGATVIRLTGELLGRIDDAAAPLAARHAAEVAQLEEQFARLGQRESAQKRLEERHKRELRRHRTDELRSGLGALAATYRDALADDSADRPEAAVAAVHRIHGALESLERNPNEQLLIQSLLWSLPVLSR